MIGLKDASTINLAIQDTLPDSVIITESAKMADIICISCKDVCGEVDLRFR